MAAKSAAPKPTLSKSSTREDIIDCVSLNKHLYERSGKTQFSIRDKLNNDGSNEVTIKLTRSSRGSRSDGDILVFENPLLELSKSVKARARKYQRELPKRERKYAAFIAEKAKWDADKATHVAAHAAWTTTKAASEADDYDGDPFTEEEPTFELEEPAEVE